MANLEQIANEAGTSISTVSRVINNKPGVGQQLRNEIRRIMSEKGLRPKTAISTSIAIVMIARVWAMDVYSSCVLGGIFSYVSSNDINLSFSFLPPKLHRSDVVDRVVESTGATGAIIIGSAVLCGDFEAFHKSDKSYMLLNNRAKGVGYVDNDSFGGAILAVEHLISLGHKEIAFLGGDVESDIDHRQRFEGYKNALKKGKIGYDDSLFIRHIPTEHAIEAGYLAMKSLLSSKKKVTAVFANDDKMAYGGIRACIEAGLRVPEDVSFVGFDDHPDSRFIHPPLSTVKQPLHEIGYKAVRYLDLFEKGIIESLPKEVLPTELVVRKTTSPRVY